MSAKPSEALGAKVVELIRISSDSRWITQPTIQSSREPLMRPHNATFCTATPPAQHRRATSCQNKLFKQARPKSYATHCHRLLPGHDRFQNLCQGIRLKTLWQLSATPLGACASQPRYSLEHMKLSRTEGAAMCSLNCQNSKLKFQTRLAKRACSSWPT